MWSLGWEQRGMFAFLILLSQKQDPSRNESYNLIKMCKCVGIVFLCECGGWMNSFAWSISLYFFSWMWLSFSFLFPSLFLTCLVGMWHTFFGYASLLLLLLLFFDMPFEHVAYLLWVCIFYFFFLSFFFIAHILDGHFIEKESWHVMEFYYVGGW